MEKRTHARVEASILVKILNADSVFDEFITTDISKGGVFIQTDTPRIINEKLDISWSQLINKYRINEAKNLLLESNKKILDIALSVGFNNKTHFNKTFKEYTNQTPSQFRDNQSKRV